MTFVFDNTYARLPEHFFARVAPTAVRAPRLIKLNRALASDLGLDADALDSSFGAEVFAGNRIPAGAEPIALAYAGHQFGGFVPQLGDGRAILLGEVVGRDGVRRDLQLKGCGRTPFSRGGDGRAALGPVLREYIVSEAMAALGIPTTRTLAAVASGESVYREDELPGAVLCRVAASHLRIGTFQYFAVREDRAAIARLVDYALSRHYPAVVDPDAGDAERALRLLDQVIAAQARLVAAWLGVGFVHGVMNTDNTALSGETIDYGPCAFLDEYDPKKKFSSIDHGGRYAFANQPRIAQWNLARFAETLLPLIDAAPERAVALASERLEAFGSAFDDAYVAVLRAKLGMTRAEADDRGLAADLLRRLADAGVDYTQFFRALCQAAETVADDLPVVRLFSQAETVTPWLASWRQRLGRESVAPADRARAMRRANPAFIPRNHRIEEAIAAARQGDFRLFETLVDVLSRPYEDQPKFAQLAVPPASEERVRATFCGT